MGTFINQGGQVFNVMAYGARGDGVTDDTAAIQQAIDDAITVSNTGPRGNVNGGGTVYFPPAEGGYNFTKLVIQPFGSTGSGLSNCQVSLVGSGPRSSALNYTGPSNSSAIIIHGLYHSRIENLAFYLTSNSDGMYQNPGGNITLIDVQPTIDESGNPLAPSTTNNRVVNCQFYLGSTQGTNIAFRFGQSDPTAKYQDNNNWEFSHCYAIGNGPTDGNIGWIIAGANTEPNTWRICEGATLCTAYITGPRYTLGTATVSTSSTTIYVLDTTFFPPSGFIQPQEIGGNHDELIYYGGKTLTIRTSLPITLETAVSGGTWTAQTAWVLYTYVNQYGESNGSAIASVPVPADGTLTIISPVAIGQGSWAATGWYAYVGTGPTPPDNSAMYRQQAAGSPTPIGQNLVLTANPTTTGANAPTSAAFVNCIRGVNDTAPETIGPGTVIAEYLTNQSYAGVPESFPNLPNEGALQYGDECSWIGDTSGNCYCVYMLLGGARSSIINAEHEGIQRIMQVGVGITANISNVNIESMTAGISNNNYSSSANVGLPLDGRGLIYLNGIVQLTIDNLIVFPPPGILIDNNNNALINAMGAPLPAVGSSIIITNSIIGAQGPFVVNVPSGWRQRYEGVINWDWDNDTGYSVDQTIVPPITLTDAARVNVDLMQGNQFVLQMTSAVGQTRTLALANATLQALTKPQLVNKIAGFPGDY